MSTTRSAISPDNPAVQAAIALDEVITGAGPGERLPRVLLSALTTTHMPWRAVAAIGATIDNINGAAIVLEALVGHQDRAALHFYSPRNDPSSILGGAFSHKVVVYATDDLGHGHVAHTEDGPKQGQYHFRPPLSVQARQFTVTFEEIATQVTATIELTPP